MSNHSSLEQVHPLAAVCVSPFYQHIVSASAGCAADANKRINFSKCTLFIKEMLFLIKK
jgi:hypothetical protein